MRSTLRGDRSSEKWKDAKHAEQTDEGWVPGGDEREWRWRDDVTEGIELVCHRLDLTQTFRSEFTQTLADSPGHPNQREGLTSFNLINRLAWPLSSSSFSLHNLSQLSLGTDPSPPPPPAPLRRRASFSFLRSSNT
jgi:hypothetical protein